MLGEGGRFFQVGVGGIDLREDFRIKDVRQVPEAAPYAVHAQGVAFRAEPVAALRAFDFISVRLQLADALPDRGPRQAEAFRDRAAGDISVPGLLEEKGYLLFRIHWVITCLTEFA